MNKRLLILLAIIMILSGALVYAINSPQNHNIEVGNNTTPINTNIVNNTTTDEIQTSELYSEITHEKVCANSNQNHDPQTKENVKNTNEKIEEKQPDGYSLRDDDAYDDINHYELKCDFHI